MTDLPEGWVSERLSEFLETRFKGKQVQQGWSPRCEAHPADEGEWGVLKTTAIQDGLFLAEHNKKLPNHLEPRPQIEVEPGDLLITCAGPRSRCGIPCLVRSTRTRLLMSGKMYRFRPDSSRVLPEFLEFALLSPQGQDQIDLMKTGGNESGLNLTHSRFLGFELDVPPLDEQREIVRILGTQLARLNTVLEALQAVRDRADQLRRSLLHAAFTGQLIDSEPKRGAADGPGLSQSESDGLVDLRTEPFSAVFDVITRGVTKVKRSTYKEFGPLPVVDQGEQKIGGYTDQENSFLGELPVILFGDHTRNVKLVDFEFAVGADGVKVLRTKTGVHPVYAYYHLLATEIRSKGYARHFSQLREKCFWVPSAPAQDEIVGILDSQLVRIEKALSLADWVEAECGRLRRSLLQAAFTGDLTKKWREANG